MPIYHNIFELIGKTPLIKLNKLPQKNWATVLAKLEKYNPGGSIKDRIAYNMIITAEKQGKLQSGGTIVEPTSGNTGVGLAMVGGARGYRVILTMPETMSLERQKLLKAYGAELVLTPGQLGMKGAINRAKELVEQNQNYFMPQQFENPANPEIHRKTTAREILADTDGKIDYLVGGVGTGGTITGAGEILKKKIPQIKIIAVEPLNSAVISGEKPGPHQIQGIGAGFIPAILQQDIIDLVIKISDQEAIDTTKKLAREEGLLLGISSGAAVAAALQIAKDVGNDQTIVVIAPDTGERYLSTGLFD